MALRGTARHLSDLARLAEKTTVPAAVSIVERFMRATVAERAAQLSQLQSEALARDVLGAAVAHHRSGIDAVLAARAACLEHAGRPWAHSVDAAALRVLAPLYGPRLTALHQLAWDDAAPEHIRVLAATARSAETVHEAGSDAEWQAAFGERRMVHAIAHLAAPDRLLAVLYSALLPRIPASMAEVARESGAGLTSGAGQWAVSGASPLRTPAGETCRAAVFYSVSSPDPLLRGLGLGRRIIFDVAHLISVRRPDVTHFATLSPIPGFVPWLRAAVGASPEARLRPSEAEAVERAAVLVRRDASGRGGLPTTDDLAALLRSGRAWFDHREARELLRPCLERLCVLYLTGGGGAPRCSVAAFHLRNGASMGRLCWSADAAGPAVGGAAGMMVNYVYSESGAAGLEATADRAARFAAEPAAVLAEQAPTLAGGE